MRIRIDEVLLNRLCFLAALLAAVAIAIWGTP